MWSRRGSALVLFLSSVDWDEYDVVSWNHPSRDKVNQEAKEVLRNCLESDYNVKAMLKSQHRDGFKDDVGLTETCFLIRNHREIKAFSDEWAACVKTCRRDQISYDYLLWKHDITVSKIPYSLRPVEKELHSGNTSHRRVKPQERTQEGLQDISAEVRREVQLKREEEAPCAEQLVLETTPST